MFILDVYIYFLSFAFFSFPSLCLCFALHSFPFLPFIALMILFSQFTMNQYKVVLIGDVGVGKSSLLRTLRSLQLHQEYKPTVGVTCTYITFPNDTHFYILDVSGSPTNEHLTQIYLRNLDAVILVFALNDPKSLQNLKEWNDNFTKSFEGDSKAVSKFVLGTKFDVQSIELQKEGQTFAESIGAKFNITSSMTGTNVEDFFTGVSEQLVQHKSLVFEFRDDCDSSKLAPLYLKDAPMAGSILVETFLDPILLDTSDEEVSYIKVEYEGLSFVNKDKTFAWRPSLNDRYSSIFTCLIFRILEN